MAFCGHVKTDGNENVLEFPYFAYDLKADVADVVFEAEITNEVFAQYNIFPVFEQAYSHNADTQKAVISETPELLDGVWTRKVVVRDFTTEELADRTKEKEAFMEFHIENFKFQASYTDEDENVIVIDRYKDYVDALEAMKTHANYPFFELTDFPTKP